MLLILGALSPAGVPGSGWCLSAGEQGWFWDDEHHKAYPKARADRLSQQQTSALLHGPCARLTGAGLTQLMDIL